MKREPVVLVMSILAALQFLFGGWAGVQVLAGNPVLAGVGAVGVLAVAAAQVGLQFYVRGQVTPVEPELGIVTAIGSFTGTGVIDLDGDRRDDRTGRFVSGG